MAVGEQMLLPAFQPPCLLCSLWPCTFFLPLWVSVCPCISGLARSVLLCLSPSLQGLEPFLPVWARGVRVG